MLRNTIVKCYVIYNSCQTSTSHTTVVKCYVTYNSCQTATARTTVVKLLHHIQQLSNSYVTKQLSNFYITYNSCQMLRNIQGRKTSM